MKMCIAFQKDAHRKNSIFACQLCANEKLKFKKIHSIQKVIVENSEQYSSSNQTMFIQWRLVLDDHFFSYLLYGFLCAESFNYVGQWPFKCELLFFWCAWPLARRRDELRFVFNCRLLNSCRIPHVVQWNFIYV